MLDSNRRTPSSRVPWKFKRRGSVEPHIQQKTSENPDLLQAAPQELWDFCRPALIDGTGLNGEERRRSAGSGTAEHAGSNSIRNPLPTDVGDHKTEAGARSKICGDGNRGDSSKALPKWAAGLAQRRSCIRGCVGRHPHHACMRAVRTAADRYELLRRGQRCHCRRWQQCSENAQQ